MATRTSKTSTVKAKTASAPKLARTRKASANRVTTPSYDDIALRAYERFCARGYVHGFDVEDWLTAERELQPD
jgi:hypothetical protein